MSKKRIAVVDRRKGISDKIVFSVAFMIFFLYAVSIVVFFGGRYSLRSKNSLRLFTSLWLCPTRSVSSTIKPRMRCLKWREQNYPGFSGIASGMPAGQVFCIFSFIYARVMCSRNLNSKPRESCIFSLFYTC